MKLPLVILSWGTLWLAVLVASASGMEQSDLFISGEDGYHTYRIPSLITTSEGTVLAFCEGRKDSKLDSGDIDLLVKRSEDGGKTWSDQQIVWDDADNTCGNPCPVIDERTGRIVMLMTWNLGSDGGRALHDGTGDNTRLVYQCHSDDDGKTWSEPVEITAQTKRDGWWWYATGPGVGIQLTQGPHKGRLVIPCDHTTADYYYGSHAIYSDDGGETWEISNAIKPSCNECQVAELSDGRLMMSMRSQEHEEAGRPRNGYRSVSFSDDGGATWSDPIFDLTLGDPVCQASLIRFDEDRLLYSHPSPPISPKRGNRIRMTLRVSHDDGKTWPHSLLIDEGTSKYSCLTKLPSGEIGLIYEADKNTLRFVRVSIEEVEGEKSASADASGSSPNVLFLAVDDMRDWVNCLGGYEGTVHTPNIDRLAERGVLFTNAHCPSPKCAPSRAAIMTGLWPSTTGLYENSHWWYPNYPEQQTIPGYFQELGYRVEGAGKIFHHTAGNNPPNQWDEFLRLTFRNDPWFRGAKINYPWSESGPNPPGFPFSDVEGLGHENDWGSLGIPEAEYDDTLSADFAVDFLLNADKAGPDTPAFFLACGLFRPHLPWYVPQKYFELYPIEEIVLPKVQEDDLEDVPEAGRKLALARNSDLAAIQQADKMREAIRAYLASISYADAQLGRVMDALDQSGQAEDTIIVLWSDHGWHLGEKQHWHKTTLWEEATRVPFLIAAPGVQPGKCHRPVSLLDIYPTLTELCGESVPEGLDGVSLLSLLQNPTASWHRPARIEYKQGNVALRNENHRYIRYADGSEELYDHRTDPMEWTNLAAQPESADLKAQLADWLPSEWAEPAATKGAYKFDPESYSWTRKVDGKMIAGAE